MTDSPDLATDRVLAPSRQTDPNQPSRRFPIAKPTGRNLHLWFGAIAVAFGVYFAFAIPPTQGLDEAAHFFRAWLVSDGDLVASERTDSVTNATHAGGVIDQCVIDYINEFTAAAALPEDFHPTDFWSETPSCQPRKRVWMNADAAANYSPLTYAPQSAAIALLRVAGAPLPAIFFGGRLAGLVTFVLLAAAAIRIAPRGKWVLAVVALIPMSVMSAAVYSADSILNGLSLLAVALVARCLLCPDASRRAFWGLTAVVILMPVIKQPYLPLALLVWLVPARLLGSPRRAIVTKLGVCAAAAAAAVLWWKVGYPHYAPTDFRPGVNYGEQLKHVLHRPDEFLKVIARTIAEGNQQLWILRGLVGSFGMGRYVGRANDVYSPLIVLLVSFGALVAAYQREATAERRDLTTPQRITYFWGPPAISLLTGLMVFFVMYMVWAPVGAPTVTELQGRYFIPILTPPVLMLILRWKAPELERQGGWLLFGMVATLTYAVGKTLLVFY